MKFGDRLFFTMTGILTVIFTVFGTWMLSAYFQQLLNREFEQIATEGQMYRYMYELAYQGMEKYGNEYAVTRAIESVADSVEKDGVSCFAMSAAGKLLYGAGITAREVFSENILMLLQEMEAGNEYACGIRTMDEKYYLIYMSMTDISGKTQYLGICRELSEIYADRENLNNQYKIALIILLAVGGVCVYVMSRIMSRPIKNLGSVAARIAAGDYEQRSGYTAPDEIGLLAADFNHMADRLVEQMREKEQEAKRREQEAMQKEQEARQKELEARQQEDFTAAFAHELKTPLTSIIGYADMLNTMALTEEERREAYYYIYSQGKRLENLSHKLLELVSLDRNDFVRKPVSAKQLEEDIRSTMRPVFRQRGIKSRVDMERGTLYGDRELLLSLLYNLLDNAGKAVEAGGFVLLKGRKTGTVYEIKVVDNGRGIPAEEIQRITEAFYMVDKSRSRKEGGAGIGLSLCKRIVELHQGMLEIVSNPGDGTVVRLILPLTEGQ